MTNFLTSLGIMGIVLLIAIWLAPMFLSIYGLVLAFKASLVLFVLVFFIQPSPLILGILAVFGHPECARMIATWLGL